MPLNLTKFDKFQNLGNEILLVEQFIEPSLCNQIIQVCECVGYQSAGIQINSVDKQIRNNKILSLDHDNSLLQSTHQLLLYKIDVVQKMLYQYYGIAFPHNEPCSILKYEPGEFYRRHIDSMLLSSRLEEAKQGIPIRDVSVVGYLNEDFVGGETYFDRQNLKIKPHTGNLIVFPSAYTHPHQSLPVTQGIKYAFNTWLFH
ncbi:MAG: 2OG-Fe(II) oxygenase [Calothrix sp. MO_167.B12]|nr:2OG-Fe(II) oxygenase [Calothrix sp. MO_167.B12]